MKVFWWGLLLNLIIINPLLAQVLTVEGYVTDGTTGESLPGVNVIIEGTTTGTTTNFDGFYKLDVPNGDVTLVFSFVGMNTTLEPVNGRTSINVALGVNSEQLEDVMVVAYGTATKEAYTGSAQVVDNEIIEDRPVTSFEKALQGTTAGLQVTSGSGQPGSTATVRIRGVGSISAGSAPLYVVDGVPIAGGLSDLNPNDIENLTVLKDAAAASLYGSRAANGVIIVTTKQGTKTGDTRISFDSKIGVSSRIGDGYRLMNSSEIYEHTWKGLYNSALINDSTIAQSVQFAHDNVEKTVGFNPFGVDNPLDDNGNVVPGSQVLTDTDWRDQVYKTGITHNYNLNVIGGSEKTQVYFSLGYFSDNGTTLGSDFQRYSAKVNLTHKVNDWITAGINNHLSYSITNAPPGGSGNANGVRAAEAINSASPVYNPDGTYNWTNQAVFDFNPVGLAEMDIYKYNTKRGLINTYLNFQILPSLNFRTTAAIDYSGDKGTNYYNPYHGNGAGVNGRSTIANSESATWNLSNILSWKKQTDILSLEILAGQEAMRQEYNVLQASGTNFAIPNYHDLVWAGSPEMPLSYTTAWSMVSYLSQAKLSYAGKYNLSASVRTDGSSRFGENYKYGVFYSVGAGWHITEEDWMPELAWLNNLKLRTSYGTSGNNNIGNYESYGLYGSGANYSGLPGIAVSQLQNQEIRWEKNEAINIGIETTMLKRFDATLDFFQRVSKDMLFDKPLSAGMGFPVLKTNLATMTNKGLEATLNYDAYQSDNFSYNVGFNFSVIRNKVIEMTTDKIIGGTKLIEEGQSLYQFYMRDWAGVNPDNGMPMWYTNASSDDVEDNEEPESAFDDPLGSGRMVTSEYADAERVRHGLAMPDYYGGITNTLKYRNVDLSFYFYFSVGGKIYNYDYASSMHDGSQPGTNLAADALNAWTPDNRYTDVPRYVVNGPDKGYELSSRFLEDGSYLRLKNITLGYDLPKQWSDAIRINGLRVFASGENIWTLTKYKGFDPEGAISGTTNNAIPGVKVFTFGVKMEL